MSSKYRVVHYINQFYGGVGGEAAGDHPMEVREGAVGPGALLQRLAIEPLEVTNTIVCGDNEFLEHEAHNVERVLSMVEGLSPDIFVAGPAFASGRYGLACLRLCVAIADRFEIPCVTAVHPESPAAGLQEKQRHVYVIPTGESAASMADAMKEISTLIARIAAVGEGQLSADADGYLPRGIRKNVVVPEGAPTRAVRTLLQKMAGQPYRSEVPVEHYEVVPPAPPVKDLKRASIALVTESGVVPVGNPDRLQAARATKWLKYSIAGMDGLYQGEYQSVHGGYDSSWVDQDPDRAAPLDALRHYEHRGDIGGLLDWMYVTCGSVGNVRVMQRIGQEIAADLVQQGVDAVILSAT